VKIYLGSPFIESIQEIPFYSIEKIFQSKFYNFQTGWVKFSELRTFNFNQLEKLFIAFLPDAFKTEEDLLVEVDEKLFLQVINS
jgi:hypothetical protein